ncbi:hypothetical protein CEXT_634121 [Caerostris extrusa]|uniref:Uncharacterized protein n=1 Tax=Caerostris extrusa TaxID=172846 RepID=A0AAV4RHD3_CAEEX|nr:hypothetical protein CEXT_634121 [Caerostris extrusa]
MSISVELYGNVRFISRNIDKEHKLISLKTKQLFDYMFDGLTFLTFVKKKPFGEDSIFRKEMNFPPNSRRLLNAMCYFLINILFPPPLHCESLLLSDYRRLLLGRG